MSIHPTLARPALARPGNRTEDGNTGVRDTLVVLCGDLAPSTGGNVHQAR